MNSEFGRDNLEALGFADATVVDSDAFIWPDHGAAEGSKSAAVVLTLIELLSFARFRTVNLRLAEKHALHIEADVEHRGVIRVSTPQGVEVADVRGLRTDRFQTDRGDRGIVSMDLREATRSALVLTDGRVIGFSFDGERMAVCNIEEDETAPLASIQAPDVAAWCETVSDTWLRDYLQSYVARDDPWRSAVTAGLFVRLRVLGPGEAREAVNRLLAGQPDLEAEKAFRWMSALADAQVSTVSDLALAEVDSLLMALEDVESFIDASADAWRNVLHDVAIRRDDLEAVRPLLLTAGALELVQPVIDHLDSVGARTIASLPERLEFDDERLNRVRLADPQAWWLQITKV